MAEMSQPAVSYKRHRFPGELITHAVWLYFRFPLSFRLIEEMPLERCIIVSYEMIRRWCLKFVAPFAFFLATQTRETSASP